MDDLTLDFGEFGSDPLLGGEETDPLDPFPPQDDGPAPVRVVLLSLDQGRFDAARSLDELAALAEANGMEAVAAVTQKRSVPEAATMLGEGKVAEARLVCANTRAEAAIFDGELSGSQIRNLSAALQVEVLDRTMLILEIFRSRAVTNEGKLQTELERYGEDRNRDGIVLVELNVYTWSADAALTDMNSQMAGATRLNTDLANGTSGIWILADPEGFEEAYGALSETLGEDWESRLYSWTDVPALADADLGSYDTAADGSSSQSVQELFADYKVAVLDDSSGLWAALTAPSE